MAQTKRKSMFEACISTASGFILSSVISIIYYYIINNKVPAVQSVGLVVILTIVSVVRTYFWRRIFNREE